MPPWDRPKSPSAQKKPWEKPDLKQEGDPVSGLESFGRGAAQDFTFGFADEMEAAARTLTGEDYDVAVSAIRDKYKKAEEENPVAYGGGQLTGAIGSSFIPGLGFVKGAKLGTRLAQAAAQGALSGYGKSEKEGMGAVKDAATSGVINLGTSGAMEGAAKATKYGGEKLYKSLFSKADRVAKKSDALPPSSIFFGDGHNAITGGTDDLLDSAVEGVNKRMDARDAIIGLSDEAGNRGSMAKALSGAQDHVNYLRTTGSEIDKVNADKFQKIIDAQMAHGERAAIPPRFEVDMIPSDPKFVPTQRPPTARTRRIEMLERNKIASPVKTIFSEGPDINTFPPVNKVDYKNPLMTELTPPTKEMVPFQFETDVPIKNFKGSYHMPDDVPDVKFIEGVPAVPGPKASQTTRIKTSYGDLVNQNEFENLRHSAEGQAFLKKIAGGFQGETEDIVSKLGANYGDDVRKLNKETQSLLTFLPEQQKKAMSEAGKHKITLVDAILAPADMGVAGTKKAVELARTSWFRSKAGKQLYKAGDGIPKNRFGAALRAAPRPVIDLMSQELIDEPEQK